MRIVLSESIRIYEVIKSIRESNETEVEILVAGDSVFSHNPVNVDYVTIAAQQLGKNVKILHQSDATPIAKSLPDKQDHNQKIIDSQIEVSEDEITSAQTNQHKKDKSITTASTKGRFSISPKKVIVVVLLLAMLLLISGGAFALYYLPRGTVTLYISERIIERSTTIVVDQDITEVATDPATVPGREVSVTVSGSSIFEASGEKTIGEQAVGSVEIRNFTTADILLGAGTVIGVTTGDGETLYYSLVSAVTVPRAVTDEDVRVAGKIVVDAVASEIGEEYNIVSGKQFWVSDFDTEDITATNTDVFTGGSTSIVTIVSSDDQDRASKELRSKLEKDLIAKLNSTISENELFEQGAIEYSTSFIEFDRQIAEEAESFSVNMEVKGVVLVVSKDDVRTVLKGELLANVPDGFALASESEVVTIQNTELVGENVQVKAKISSLVVPTLDIDAIRSELLGLKVHQAQEYIKNIDTVEGYDINLWPALPDSLKSLPHIEDRLLVTTEIRGD